MNILKDNEYKQSRKMLMAKSAGPEQLQDGIDATPACHVLSVFGVFLSNQSIAHIDISCPINNQVSASNSPVTPKSLFSAASLRGMESISGCTFNFVSGFEENSSSNAVK